MIKLASMWVRYGTARNRKVLYIVLSLVALAVAAAAPSGGSGAGSGGGLGESFIWLP
ncbi:MAG TPA: hypothetical protein VLC95_07435 [Anaerolineae bacterium]|nr:hypothetical protein [Anaerolineae bacterium]